MALALRKRGIHAEVFEQSSKLAEIGAAGSPSANSTRELGRLGLLDSLARALTEPDELIWRYGRSGQRLKSQPVRRGDAYRRRFGAHHLAITGQVSRSYYRVHMDSRGSILFTS